MAQLDFTVAEDEFDDSESGLNSVDSSSLYSDDDSLEAIAGISPDTDVPDAEPANEAVVDVLKSKNRKVRRPGQGLPEEWTMEQWKWYGQMA